MKVTLVALVMAAGVALSSLSTSAGAQAESVSDAPVAVTMFASPPSDVQNLNTNWFTKYVEKTFNMQIKWSIATSSDATTKQELLLASGNYPDMFWAGSFSNAELLKYGHRGVLVPLNIYIQQYAPNVVKAMKEFPGLKQDMVAPDGNIYGIPNINYCWHCYWSSMMWINTKWLKQLHLKMPTTPAQFMQVLEAFKARHPEGVKNTIPLDGAIDGYNTDLTTFLMNAFIYDEGNVFGSAPADHFFIQNGKVAFAPIQPQWKQGLAYIHSLYTHGLINSTALTQQNDQLKSQAQQGIVGAFPDGGAHDVINYGAPGSDWQYWWAVPPLKGPNGVNYAAFYGQGPSGATFTVTNKATPDQIKAVMKLINFLFTVKGTTMLDFGPPGKYWSWAKKGQKGLTGGQALINVAWNKFYNGAALQNWGWDQMGPIDQSQAWREGGVAIPMTLPSGSQTKVQVITQRYYAGHQPTYVYPSAVWIPSAEVQQYQMLQTNINNFVAQWTAEFITGHKDITKDWASYVQGVQNLGLSQYLQMAQKAMGKPFDTSAFKGKGLGH
jgi:putative aldouronate transport system substrate-binding protein